jgi:hypothetical protein
VKRLILLIALLLPGLCALAGEPYFCLQTGRTLYYERTKASNGRLERTTTMRIGAVSPSGTGRRVEYVFLLQGPGGKDLYGGEAPMETEIASDGSVRMDVGAQLGAVLRNLFPNAAVSASGRPALLPAGMKPGDRLPDAHSSVSAGVLTYTVDITEREVLRAERVTVPAGTFDCLVVREHKVERGPGRNRTTTSESWYVAGLGYVRHDTYDKNLRLETTEVLKNY